MSELSKLTCGDPRKPPLIFLHGFLGVKEDWLEIISYFESDFFCIAYDLPGHGKSPYIESVVSAIQAEIAPLNPYLVGYSLGGRLGLQMHACAKTFVAISAHPGLSTAEEKNARLQNDEVWCQKLLHLPIESFLTEWYAQSIFQPFPNNPSLVQFLIKRRMKQNPQDLVRVLRQTSLAHQEKIQAFHCPTLFLYGEHDLKYRDLYSKLPTHAAVRCIAKCGHAVHIQNPKECANEIRNWIHRSHQLASV
ncbi:MAG: alpha/beta fold hydrolase [Candidatus Melainabacteria bacterium]|nr:alpha/beta fold hydrolase [Candidatus Melainabacteria bacterium]